MMTEPNDRGRELRTLKMQKLRSYVKTSRKVWKVVRPLGLTRRKLSVLPEDKRDELGSPACLCGILRQLGLEFFPRMFNLACRGAASWRVLAESGSTRGRP
jgi:ribosomal protein L30/L7E